MDMNTKTLKEIEETCELISMRPFQSFVNSQIKGFHFTYLENPEGWNSVSIGFMQQCRRVANKEIEFKAYKSRNPYSKANGFVLAGDDSTIWINSRKNLSSDAMLGFIVHELMHFAGFNHGKGHYANSMRWWHRGRKKLSSPPVMVARFSIDYRKRGITK